MRDVTPEHQPPISSASSGDATSLETRALQPDDLHDLFEVSSPANIEDDPLAAMRNDPNYAALIRDLEYIAAQARLLFQPAELTPSDSVWDKIQSKLGETSDEPEELPNNKFNDDLGGEPALVAG
jgi:hypothetical protein